MEEYFKGKRVLVTGGTGMIGCQVVKILADMGAIVFSVSLDQVRQWPERAQYIKADLTDYHKCINLTYTMDCVAHVAGIKGSVVMTRERPASFFVPLLMMNTNVLEACRVNRVKKVVYTSSIGAYQSAEIFVETEYDNYSSPPMDEFPGWAKRMGELQIEAYKRQYGLNYGVVRPCNVYGPWDNFNPETAMVIPSLMEKMYCNIYGDGKPVMAWGDGSAIRDFAYSYDIAMGIVQALYHGTGGRYVNLGSGKGVSIVELLEDLQEVVEFDYVFDESKPSGFPKRVMDISLAQELIGYEVTTLLRDGLASTWSWYIQNRDFLQGRQDYFKE